MFKKFLAVLLGLSLITCGQLQAAPQTNNGQSKERPGQVEHGKQYAPGQVKKVNPEDPQELVMLICVAAAVVVVGGTVIYVYYKSAKCIDNPRCDTCNRKLRPGDDRCGTCLEPVPPGTWPEPDPEPEADSVSAVYTTPEGVEYTYWNPIGTELQTTTDLINWTPLSFVGNTWIDTMDETKIYFANSIEEWEAVERLGLYAEGNGEFLECFSTNTLAPAPMRFFREVELGIETE